MMPFARNPVFTGREELLARLRAQLQSTHAATLGQPQAISGLGGFGKTQLAVEYAYRWRAESQAVLWVRADTSQTLNASYTEIAQALDLPQKGVQEQAAIIQAVKRWLQNTPGWLLILDNADNLAVARPFIPVLCPGHLVLTTRAQTLAWREQHLGNDHVNTANSLDRAARWWELQGKYKQAEPLFHFQEAQAFYERALAIYERTLGLEHPRTQNIQRMYLTCLEKIRQDEAGL